MSTEKLIVSIGQSSDIYWLFIYFALFFICLFIMMFCVLPLFFQDQQVGCDCKYFCSFGIGMITVSFALANVLTFLLHSILFGQVTTLKNLLLFTSNSFSSFMRSHYITLNLLTMFIPIIIMALTFLYGNVYSLFLLFEKQVDLDENNPFEISIVEESLDDKKQKQPNNSFIVEILQAYRSVFLFLWNAYWFMVVILLTENIIMERKDISAIYLTFYSAVYPLGFVFGFVIFCRIIWAWLTQPNSKEKEI